MEETSSVFNGKLNILVPSSSRKIDSYSKLFAESIGTSTLPGQSYLQPCSFLFVVGGKIGFGDVIWRVKKFKQDGPAPYITFAYRNVDGEQGFPGVVAAYVTYMLYGNQKLSVIMKAIALNKATPINLAQHTY
ncbi:hypothetical protein IFM89_032609 [Coptis chinensis]|uniref:Uncharacterized protein n=1 Tax=Coptis chinensis TaxID=261450 RepID=A0A835M7L3_9MAGN|nr:hypothetical protein IFM89_032609 [Coptis chinensis]